MSKILFEADEIEEAVLSHFSERINRVMGYKPDAQIKLKCWWSDNTGADIYEPEITVEEVKPDDTK